MWFKLNKFDNKNSEFNNFIYNFVIQCPCTFKNTKALVSQRGNTFKKRGIQKDLLNTLNAEIKHMFIKSETYVKLQNNSNNSVDSYRTSLLQSDKYKDPYFEFIIFKKRTDMSDTETIYYCIRNAFAHGSFTIIQNDSTKMYLMHCEKNKDTKADMRLKETTLLRLIELKNMNQSQIKKLRNKRKNKKYKGSK